jgi:hypothetical protein
VVIAIIGILASLLLPALSKARDKAKYARWLGHKKNLEADTDAVAVYTFQDDQGDTLANTAVGLEGDTGYRAERYDGTVSGAAWTEGRWRAKRGLAFDGSNDHVDAGNWDVDSQGGDGDGITIGGGRQHRCVGQDRDEQGDRYSDRR